MKKILLCSVLALSSCVSIPQSPLTETVSAEWHRRADIKRICILIDEEVYFYTNEEEKMMLGLRTAFQKRNILSMSHTEKETEINHREITKNKVEAFNPTHVFYIRLDGKKISLLIRSVEKGKDVWKGYIDYIGDGTKTAESIIQNLIEKNVL